MCSCVITFSCITGTSACTRHHRTLTLGNKIVLHCVPHSPLLRSNFGLLWVWWCGDSGGNWLIKGMLINIRGVGGGGEVWFKSLSKASLYKLRSLYAISRHLHRLDGLNSRASPRTITFLDLGFFVCLKTVCGVIIRPSAPLCVRGLIDIGSGVFSLLFSSSLSPAFLCV